MKLTRDRWRPLKSLAEWPLLRQLVNLGMGSEAASRHTRHWKARVLDADKKIVSVCPYCAVGCSQLIYVKNGSIINIEGNPDSPINQGTLCPKGAATFELLSNPNRWTTVKYRAPYSDQWEDKPLDWAMERIAQLTKKTRDENWRQENEQGDAVRHTTAIASLGDATLDNEENYFIKKLFTGGLGMVWIENQARI